MRIKISAKALFDIVNNSRNPKVAMQLIDGSYKKPNLPQTGYMGKEQLTATLVSYDKWTDRVMCKDSNGETQTMSSVEWIRACESMEDILLTSPGDLKIMEAMAVDQMEGE